jgi:adenylate kinase
MIIVFGSQGSGKSTQCEILVEKYGWKWLSTGKMFRGSNNAEIKNLINAGRLVPDEIADPMVFEAIDKNSTRGEKGGLILDGYPRKLAQAKSLARHNLDHFGQFNINLALMLDVDKAEVVERMLLRGREDDTPESIEKRLGIYHEEIEPILNYFSQEKIPVVHVDGKGSIEDIHRRIDVELVRHGIVP